MKFADRILDKLGHWLARYLVAREPEPWPYAPADPEALARTLRPGDVVLVSGSEKVSTAIKYLTQSTWSHAALYVGPMPERTTEDGEVHCLVEVNLGEGCVSAPLSKYAGAHTRICRPVAMTPQDRADVVRFMVSRIGLQYDLRNVIDLARYLVPVIPVPARWRRRMIALGSGEPTRAICSTLIAQAFQRVRYPILPRVERVRAVRLSISRYSRSEILHIRHHSLFAPCDFDLSPYFQIVKPTLEDGFNYKGLVWADDLDVTEEPTQPADGRSQDADEPSATTTTS